MGRLVPRVPEIDVFAKLESGRGRPEGRVGVGRGSRPEGRVGVGRGRRPEDQVGVGRGRHLVEAVVVRRLRQKPEC